MIRTIATFANFVVRVVRRAHRQQVWLSVAGLVLILVVATAYLLVGALRVKPFASSYRVTVQLPESGGLLPIRMSRCAGCASAVWSRCRSPTTG